MKLIENVSADVRTPETKQTRVRSIRVATTAAVAALVVFNVGGLARATVVTGTFDVTATGFDYTTYGATPPVPTDPMLLSFKITYDPTVNTTQSSDGITLDSVNVSYSLPLEFYVSGPDLYVGTFSQGGGLDSGFDVDIQTSGNGYIINLARYITSGGTYADVGGTGTVTFTPASSVPEPAMWTMMLVGIGGVGGAARVARRKNMTATA